MHKKIRQRFSLSHSTTETTPEPMKSYNETISNNNQSSKPPKHKKKKSLVETFKNFPPFHGTKHSENKHKITDLTMPKQIKKSLSFSHGNNTNKKTSLLPNVKKKKIKHRNERSNSFGANNINIHNTVNSIPEAEEEKIDFGEDFSGDDYDDSYNKSFTFSPSPKHISTPMFKKSKSTQQWMSNSNSFLPNSFLPNSNSFSPSLSRSPRTFVEHEKNTLIDQMRQLQSSMVQLGDMLRNQDKTLIQEKEKNEKLTEQINNLADENINLRAELQRYRRNQQSAWGDLEFYKLAARSRRDKNLILSNQLNIVETQKAELSQYSQQLLQQLNTEKEKNKSLTIRIRKYSRNVKSLHKKTSSLSGINKYTRQHLSNNGGSIPLISAKSDPCDRNIGINNNVQLDIVKDTSNKPINQSYSVSINDENNNINNNSAFEQKKRELKHLEEQTLEILNQLQQDTRTLLGETKGLKSRNKSRLNNKKKRKKSKNVKSKTTNDNNKDPNIDAIGNTNDIVIITKTKMKTKTKTKTKAIIKGSNIDINVTTSKIETKSKTKTKTKRKINVNITDESNVCVNEEGDTNGNTVLSETETETETQNECNIGTENDFRNPINDKSHSNSSQEWDSDDEGLVSLEHEHDNDINININNNQKKRKSIDLNEYDNDNDNDKEMTLISDDDEDELDEPLVTDADLKEINKQAKQEVKVLRHADAPVSLLFAAFEKQMASERTDSEDSENENNNKNGVNIPSKVTKVSTDDTPSVANQFANFNGFSSDDNDDANNALENLWG